MTTQKKMDARVREKLYGLLPFSTKATREFTPAMYTSDDFPRAYRPVFKIRPFNKEEIVEARTLLKEMQSGKVDIDKEDQLNDLSRKIVVGWSNLYDCGTGNEIEYKADDNGGAGQDLYDSIPTTAKAHILIEAVKISGLVDTAKLGLKS